MNWKIKLVILSVLVLILGSLFGAFLGLKPSTRLFFILFITVLAGLVWISKVTRITGNGEFLLNWKYEFDLTDKQILGVIFLLMLIGFLIGQFFHLGTQVYVDPYRLDISLLPDKAEVHEKLVFNVPPDVRGHEFYRSYHLTGPMKGMKVNSVHCPPGFQEKVYNYSDEVELACRSKDYVKPGVYPVEFDYTIPKPYVCYTNLCFFDWNALTDFSLDIKNARVNVTGAERVWGYPPLDSSFDLPANTLLEVKAIKPRSQVTGIWKEVNEPDSMIFAKEWETSLAAAFYKYSLLISLGILALVFAGLFTIYLLFGKEVQVTGIPDILHYPPTNRKPYDVNRIVFGDPNKIEYEGIQATLLDLARRGWIKIEDGKIEFLKGKDKLDDYERDVYETYKWLGSFTGGTLDIKELENKIKSSTDTGWLMDIQRKLERLTRDGSSVFSFSGKFFALLWLVFWIVSLSLIGWLMPKNMALGLSISLWVGIFSLPFIDSYCFGRYDPEIYKEILLWKAFARLLGDYSLIKKYAPQDIRMWGDWLVYATALGKAENVIRAMKEFNIRVPNIDYDAYTYTHPYIIYSVASTRYAYLSSPKSGSGWSGGGGFGGGFGGGGGGFR